MFNDFISNLRSVTQGQVHKPNFEAFPSPDRIANSIRRGENNTNQKASGFLYGARWLGDSVGDYNSPDYFSKSGNISDKFGNKKVEVRSRDNWDNPFEMSISYDDDGSISQINVANAGDYYAKMGIENKTYKGANAISDLFKRMNLDSVEYHATDYTDANNKNPSSVWFGANSDNYAPANVFGSNGVLFGTAKGKDTRDWNYESSGQYREYLNRYNNKFMENWRKNR